MPEPEIKGLGVLNRTPSLVEIFQDSNFQTQSYQLDSRPLLISHF